MTQRTSASNAEVLPFGVFSFVWDLGFGIWDFLVVGRALAVFGLVFFAAAASVSAQSASAAADSDTLISVTARVAADDEALWTLDPATRRLAIYRYAGGKLTLLFARNVTWDLQMVEYTRDGAQIPTVKKMAADWKNAQPAKPGEKPELPAPGPERLAFVKAALQGSIDGVWIVDQGARRMALYRTDGRTLELLAVRDLRADLLAEQFSAPGSSQSPVVADVKEQVEKQSKLGQE